MNELLIEIIRSKITSKIHRNAIDIIKWKKFKICKMEEFSNLFNPKARKLTEYLHDGDGHLLLRDHSTTALKNIKTDEQLDKGNCI
ncbi:MAG: hypothetical protein IPG87_19870 [Saprospiraceae bacterium]|nr:hypothetical protein [Candidatus Vicinibacter affinis]